MRKTALILIAATGALAATNPTLAQGDWAPGIFRDWGWGHMAFGGGTMLLVWGGIILLIVLLVRGVSNISGPRETAPRRQTALEVLQERYARGEIAKEEYEERRRTLTAA